MYERRGRGLRPVPQKKETCGKREHGSRSTATRETCGSGLQSATGAPNPVAPAVIIMAPVAAFDLPDREQSLVVAAPQARD
jgi:hypothetical protein